VEKKEKSLHPFLSGTPIEMEHNGKRRTPVGRGRRGGKEGLSSFYKKRGRAATLLKREKR